MHLVFTLAQLIVAFACGSAMIWIGMENGYAIGGAAMGGAMVFNWAVERWLLRDR